MDEWYYKLGDAEFGPISDAELRALLEREKNAAEIQVRRNGSDEWAAAAQPAAKHPPSVPPPLPPAAPASPPPVAPARIAAGPTGWLWFSAMLLAMNLVVVAFMQFVFATYALFLLAGITGLPDWFTQCVNAFDSRVIWPEVSMFVLLILWQGCAFGSILKLYAQSKIEHGRGSGFWWITPVANLFMPFHCLRELRWASLKRRVPSETEISAGVLTWMIQAVIIIKIFAAIADRLVLVTSTAASGTAEESTSTLATLTNLITNCCGVALAGLLIVYVLRNLIHQIRLYRGWNTSEAAA